jgi:hypothetical protein
VAWKLFAGLGGFDEMILKLIRQLLPSPSFFFISFLYFMVHSFSLASFAREDDCAVVSGVDPF